MDKLTKEILDKDKYLRRTHNKIDKIEDWDLLPDKPMVTVCMATYNHENYICEALDGVLMQKVNFDYEVIIKEDFSTDKTREIVIEYQKKYPDKIRLWLCKENLYSQKQSPKVRLFARGKYSASCEGDDYWTDPLKLQKQVDFLDANPDYTVVVGGFISKHEYTKHTKTIIRKNKTGGGNKANGYSFTLEDTYKNWSTKVLTALHINDKELLSCLTEYKYNRDVHLFYHLLKKGKGFYFTEVFGVHRIHSGGVHSMVDERKLIIGAYHIYNELYIKNKDEYTRKMSLNYHCMVLNLKTYNNKFIKSYNIKTSILLKNIIKLIKYPVDILLLYQIFIGGNFKRKIKHLLKRA